MKKRIIWDSQKLEIDTMTSRIKYSDYNNEYREVENEELKEEFAKTLSMTPFGIFKVDDSMHPFKQFKIWMGHTNFKLTKPIIHKMKQINGIELLRVITRHRFIVGIGKAFEPLTVRKNIEESICECVCIPNEEVQNKVDKLSEVISIYNFWSILAFPNGNIELTVSNQDDEDLQKIRNTMKECSNLTGGIIVNNE